MPQAPRGCSGRSASRPAVRIRSAHCSRSRFSSVSSVRAVAATIRGASGVRDRQNVRNVSVSGSHHWMLSRVSNTGRPPPISARARPSKNRRRCQASTIARTPAPGSGRAAPDGTSLSTSARQIGSSAVSAGCTAGVRSQSATGARASRPDVPKHWVPATTAAGCARALSAISATRRVLPTPAPPVTRTRVGCPAAAVRHVSCSRRSSRVRPTSVGAASPGRSAAGPAMGRAVAVGSAGASRRSARVRVAGSGASPSSRSRTAAQR